MASRAGLSRNALATTLGVGSGSGSRRKPRSRSRCPRVGRTTACCRVVSGAGGVMAGGRVWACTSRPPGPSAHATNAGMTIARKPPKHGLTVEVTPPYGGPRAGGFQFSTVRPSESSRRPAAPLPPPHFGRGGGRHQPRIQNGRGERMRGMGGMSDIVPGGDGPSRRGVPEGNQKRQPALVAVWRALVARVIGLRVYGPARLGWSERRRARMSWKGPVTALHSRRGPPRAGIQGELPPGTPPSPRAVPRFPIPESRQRSGRFRVTRARRSSDRAAAPDRRRARCSRGSPRPFPRPTLPRPPRPPDGAMK